MTVMNLQEHPFVGARVAKHVAPAGLTIAEMIAHAAGGLKTTSALHVVIRRNGQSREVPAQLWDRLRPKEGAQILITRMPEDGATLRSIAMIAVMAAAVAAGQWYALNGAGFLGMSAASASVFVQAGVTMVGSLVLPADFPEGE